MVELPAGNFHSFMCATYYAQAKSEKLRAKSKKLRERKAAKAHTQKKKELKDNDKKFQLKKTQQIFNSYVRLRDDGLPCISCLRSHEGQYHAGHYRTVGANPELRFDERNCHKQCAPCNNHLSGNLVNYRINLIAKMGVGIIDFLEGPHAPKRYTIDQLKILQRWFKRKTRRLENVND
jgi:hypothetical protein